MAICVPAGGVALLYQSLTLEGLDGTNGCVAGNATGFGDGLVAGPAYGVLSSARNQIAVNSELYRRQPVLEYAVRHPVIS